LKLSLLPLFIGEMGRCLPPRGLRKIFERIPITKFTPFSYFTKKLRKPYGKVLYGLKQAPRAWNKRIDSFLTSFGFEKFSIEHGVYIKIVSETEIVVLCLYVDDLLITSSSLTAIEALKQGLKSEFEMTDLAILPYFLWFEFAYTEKGIFMHQKKYISEVLKKFRMMGCKPAETPTELNLKLVKCEEEGSVDGTMFR